MAIGSIDTPPEYQGCFREDPTKPDLSGEPPLTVSTPEACLLHCAIGTWTYAGIRNGAICTCGDEKGHYGLAISPNECSIPCPPNTVVGGGVVEWCGGPEVNSVYKVGNYSSMIPPGSNMTDPGGQVRPTMLPTHPDHENGSSGGGDGIHVGPSSAVVIGSVVGSVVVLACGIMLFVMRRRRARSKANIVYETKGGDLSKEHGGDHPNTNSTDFVSDKNSPPNYPSPSQQHRHGYHTLSPQNGTASHIPNNNNSSSNAMGSPSSVIANVVAPLSPSPSSPGGKVGGKHQLAQQRSLVGNMILEETVRGGTFDSDDDSDGKAVDPINTDATETSATRSPTATSPATTALTGFFAQHHQSPVNESLGAKVGSSSPPIHRRTSRQKHRSNATALKGGHGNVSDISGTGGLRIETGTGKPSGTLSPPHGKPPVSPMSPVSPVSPLSPPSKQHPGGSSTNPATTTYPASPNALLSTSAHTSVVIPPSPTTPPATATGSPVSQMPPNQAVTPPQQPSPQLRGTQRRSVQQHHSQYWYHYAPDTSPASPASPAPPASSTPAPLSPSTLPKSDDDLDELEWSLPYSRPYYPPASPYASTVSQKKTDRKHSNNIPAREHNEHDGSVEGEEDDDGVDVVIINTSSPTFGPAQGSEDARQRQEEEIKIRKQDSESPKEESLSDKPLASGSVYPRSTATPLNVTTTTKAPASPLSSSPSSPLHLSPTSHLRPPELMHHRNLHVSTLGTSSSSSSSSSSPPPPPSPPRILIHEAE